MEQIGALVREVARSIVVSAEKGSSKRCEKCSDVGILDFLRHTSWRKEPPGDVPFCDCTVGKEKEQEGIRIFRRTQSRRIANLFYRPGIPKRFARFTLDTFPVRAGKTNGLRAARQYMEKGYVTCKDGQERNSIFFWGPVGTGKTGLATPIMQKWLDEGRIAIFQEYYEFMANLQAMYGNGGDSNAYLQAAQEVELLVLDDLGSEDNSRGKETSDKTEKLFRLLNHRHSSELPTILTSNLGLDGIEVFFEKRIASRIFEMCALVLVNGGDLRVPEKRR